MLPSFCPIIKPFVRTGRQKCNLTCATATGPRHLVWWPNFAGALRIPTRPHVHASTVGAIGVACDCCTFHCHCFTEPPTPATATDQSEGRSASDHWKLEVTYHPTVPLVSTERNQRRNNGTTKVPDLPLKYCTCPKCPQKKSPWSLRGLLVQWSHLFPARCKPI